MYDLEQIKSEMTDLEERIAALNEECAPLRKQMGNIDRTRGQLVAKLEELRGRMAEAKSAPRVSDHAVIRYLERKHGFDFEHVRNELLTPAVVKAMEVGAEVVKITGGTLKLRGKTIVTFIGK